MKTILNYLVVFLAFAIVAARSEETPRNVGPYLKIEHVADYQDKSIRRLIVTTDSSFAESLKDPFLNTDAHLLDGADFSKVVSFFTARVGRSEQPRMNPAGFGKFEVSYFKASGENKVFSLMLDRSSSLATFEAFVRFLTDQNIKGGLSKDVEALIHSIQ